MIGTGEENLAKQNTCNVTYSVVVVFICAHTQKHKHRYTQTHTHTRLVNLRWSTADRRGGVCVEGRGGGGYNAYLVKF